MSAGSTIPRELSATATSHRSSSDLPHTEPGRYAPAGDDFATIGSPILQAAARRLASRWRDGAGEAADLAEAVEQLGLLAAGVERLVVDAGAAVDQRVHSVLGRSLLELLRAEVVRSWAEHGDATEGSAILQAIERMREAVEPRSAQDFITRLSGSDGLEMLVQIAHDLRSPLTSILFLAETLQRGQSGSVTELQRRQLGLIYGAALGLSSVASDVIELARGGDQLVEKESEPFSVTGVFDSVRDIVWPIAEEKRLTVRVLPPPTDHRLGHPIALGRVLLNLTTNALKFTDEGYVEIVTRETAPTRVEFAVRDSGKGIDPAVLNSLYQPFRRSVGRGRPRFSETGLGLTMCRKLVEAMDSKLQVETRPGWGTRFFFELELPPYLPR